MIYLKKNDSKYIRYSNVTRHEIDPWLVFQRIHLCFLFLLHNMIMDILFKSLFHKKVSCKIEEMVFILWIKVITQPSVMVFVENPLGACHS